jgi:hypothetical protein
MTRPDHPLREIAQPETPTSCRRFWLQHSPGKADETVMSYTDAGGTASCFHALPGNARKFEKKL